MSDVVHLINNLNHGGAQSTLRQLNVINRTYVLHGKEGLSIFKLFFLIISSRKTIIINSWLYHSSLIACILKIFCKKKLKVFVNIRNGYASPNDIKFLTRCVVRVLSYIAPHNTERVIFCSQQSILEHQDNNLFKYTNNIVIRNGIKVKNDPIPKKLLKFCMVARYEPQKNFVLLKEILRWFEDHSKELNILTDKKDELKNFLDFSSNYINIYDNNDISVKEIMSNASHHILISKSEGFANVNLEALSSGCSLLCTRVGDADIFPKKWCSIVKPDALHIKETLDHINQSFDVQKFNLEIKEKIEYLKKNFLPNKEEDYYV